MYKLMMAAERSADKESRMATWLTHLQWTRIERAIAVLTVANGAISLIVCGVRLFHHDAVGAAPLLALLGLLSGVLAWRGRVAGHATGLAFYALQLASYYSYDFTLAYQLRGGLSLGFVAHLPSGVLVVNVFAIAMLAASAVLLCWRLRPGTAIAKGISGYSHR